MPFETPMNYKQGNNSSVGANLITFYYYRKALIDMKKEQYFGQLADVTAMPKHMGKTIKRYHYIPLLDDRNINDQGIDATGASTANEVTIVITNADGDVPYNAVGTGADAAAALTAAKAVAVDIFTELGVFDTNYATTKTALTTAGWTVVEGTAVNGAGNLWGSSKDIGAIMGKLPTIGENGGRVNRVGFTRVDLEGTITNYGFFDEYTKDSINFDNDSELLSHITRESLKAANEIVESLIQIDLLNGAGITMFGGNATSTATLTGNTGSTATTLSYDMLVRLNTRLNQNRCPKDTDVITGSRMTDTKTVGYARYAYIGSELKRNILKMTDYHNNKAFVPIQQYGAAGTIARGEIGAIDNFRFIEVPEMFHWAGVGATVTTNAGYKESGGKYNAYPVLVVGSNAFTTIGFETSGENVKFEIIHKAPSSNTADRNDPYGKTGFYSIQWWYGTMILRPEWIGVIKVVAER